MAPALLDSQLVETFVALSDTLVDDFDVVEFLSDLAERIVKLGLATEVGILLADEDDSLEFVAASHERAHLLELFQVQNDQGPCRDAFESGEPVDTADLRQDVERWPLFAPRALDAGFRSVQAVPLRLRGEVLGALNLFNGDVGPVDPRVLTVVQALADVATISMLQQRQLLYEYSDVDSYTEALYLASMAAITGEPTTLSGFARVMDVVLAAFSVAVFATLAGTVGAFLLERASDEH